MLALQNVADWGTATEGNPGAYIILQSDGNLVVLTSDDKTLWHSHTDGIRNIDHLIMQNDGHLVLYKNDGSAAWWHRTGNINNWKKLVIKIGICTIRFYYIILNISKSNNY